jgi:hypothetical protein
MLNDLPLASMNFGLGNGRHCVRGWATLAPAQALN